MKRMLTLLLLAAAGSAFPAATTTEPTTNLSDKSSANPMMNTATMFILWVARAPQDCFAPTDWIMRRNDDITELVRLRDILHHYSIQIALLEKKGDPLEGDYARKILAPWAAAVVDRTHDLDKWIAQHRWKLFCEAMPKQGPPN